MTPDDEAKYAAWAAVALGVALFLLPWDWPGKWFSWAVSWYRRRMKHPVR